MAEFTAHFLSNPMLYVGGLLAFFAALGFLIYLRGFIGGIGNVFTLAGHVEHVTHANARAVWGLGILTTAFVAWEMLRFFPIIAIAILIAWVFVYLIYFAH